MKFHLVVQILILPACAGFSVQPSMLTNKRYSEGRSGDIADIKISEMSSMLSSAVTRAFAGHLKSHFSIPLCPNFWRSCPSKVCFMMSSMDYAERDAVLFTLPGDWAAAYGKEYGLGGVLKINGESEVQLQLLCIREAGSTEFYVDSRVEPVTVPAADVVKVQNQ